MGFIFRLLAIFLFSANVSAAATAADRRRQRLSSPAPFATPLVPAGTSIPVVYGTWIVRPTTVWIGKVKILPVYVGQPQKLLGAVIGPPVLIQTGYQYTVTSFSVLCWGQAGLTNMVFGGKALSAQAQRQTADFAAPDPATGNITLSDDKISGDFLRDGALDLQIYHGGRGTSVLFLPNVYGGPGHGGGVFGTITFAIGSRQYAPDPVMVAALGAENVPSYGDFATVTYDGLTLGESATPPPIDYIVRSKGGEVNGRFVGPEGKQWFVGDTSAAAILLDALTNRFYGLGLDASEIHVDSFTAAHATLEGEKLGMSCIAGGSSGPDVSTFQRLKEECERHAGGILRRNAETAQWEFKLLRDESSHYGELPSYDERETWDVDIHDTMSSEVSNSVTVEFSDAEQFYQPNTVTLTNDANIAETNSVRNVKVQYLGITDRITAWQVCARELKERSTRLKRGQLKGTRAWWAARPGDVVRLSNDRNRLDNLLIRILSVDLGTPEDATISVTFVEDVFSHPTVARTDYPTVPTPQPQTIVRPQITALRTTVAAGVGTLEFDVIDPEHRITSVAVATQSGTGAMSAYATLATASPDPSDPTFPFNDQVTDDDLSGTYSTTVPLSVFGQSTIVVRLRYVGFSTIDVPLLDIQETFASAGLPTLRRVGVPALSFVYSGSNVVITAAAPDATSVKIAAKLSSEPTDTEIRAASAGTTLTIAAPISGQVLYADAFAYEGSDESARSPTLTIPGIATTGSRGNINIIVRDGSGGFVPVLTSAGGNVVV